MTVTETPRSTNSPREAQATNWSPNRALPAGANGVVVTPVVPSRCEKSTIASRLAMCPSAEAAQIEEYRDQQPQEIDSDGRHVIVYFPGVDERCEG